MALLAAAMMKNRLFLGGEGMDQFREGVVPD